MATRWRNRTGGIDVGFPQMQSNIVARCAGDNSLACRYLAARRNRMEGTEMDIVRLWFWVVARCADDAPAHPKLIAARRY